MVLSWIFSLTQVYEYRIFLNFADFLYYCYELFTDGIEWLMSAEKVYNKVVAFTKRRIIMANHVDNYISIEIAMYKN